MNWPQHLATPPSRQPERVRKAVRVAGRSMLLKNEQGKLKMKGYSSSSK